MSSCLKDGIFLIGFVPTTLCLLLVTWIIFNSIYQLTKLKKLQNTIKNLYYLSCILCIIILIITTANSFFCKISKLSTLLSLLSGVFYYVMVFTILAILILRVHFTFKDSMFRISKCQLWTFIILYVFSVSSSILPMSIYFAFIISNSENGLVWYFEENRELQYLTLITCVLYIGTSAFGMQLFVKRMYRLIKLRATSMKSVMDENAVKLNKTQTKLMNQASKYVSLLCIAVLSTIMAYTVYLVVFPYQTDNAGDKQTRIAAQIIVFITSFDCAVNMICLYLQYRCSKY